MIEKYFNGEKVQCWIGVLMALMSICTAIYFMVQVKKPFTTGISYPFLIISSLLLVICVGVIVRSPKDVIRVTHMVQAEKEKIRTEELPRMEAVMRNFRIIKAMEMTIAAVGILLLLVMPAESLWRGVGLGVLIQAVMMLLFDIVAESRGKEYFEYLQSL